MPSKDPEFKVRIAPEDAAKLREIARREERPINGLIRLAIRRFLEALPDRA